MSVFYSARPFAELGPSCLGAAICGWADHDSRVYTR
jgi:hypothetical protein